MRVHRGFTLLAVAATALAMTGTAAAVASSPSVPHATFHHGLAVPQGTGVAAVCAKPANPHLAQCLAEGVTVAPGSKQVLTTKVYVNGLGPADIQDAYNLPADQGDGVTVAVVEAGNYIDIDKDLQVWRSNFGLPACTEANGCLTVVNGQGGSQLPPRRNGWSIETALDVDAVSAACPLCHILVVEAKGVHYQELGRANATAARMGAVAISNSWKIPEFQGMDQGQNDAWFDHTGVADLASSGDGGHTSIVTIGYPAGLPNEIAVGGTLLQRTSNARGWTESAWSGAGSACGVYVAKQPWQKDKGCDFRTTSDVSADASPASGLAVYHTLPKQGGGWSVYGGTSLSSPLLAGVYGLADNTGTLGDGIAAHLYANTQHLYDVTTGSNGTICSKKQSYICNAGPGYDGPTGLGTPNGIAAF